ncbi:GlcG/HbpS family heme-binding protein [Mycobacterium sp. 050134]|uniref:GlcG/HbpS family heme-binding protein n=1 Tax=Mycobacterium sp. 050134 TaxID=3096111 RepID=UPI002EDB7767
MDVDTFSTLNLAGAQRVVDGSLSFARSTQVPVCVAVTDRSGHLLAFARMDGAPLLGMSIARDKAHTVTAFGGLATHELFDLIKDDPAVLQGIVKTAGLIVFGGGVAVRCGGQLVGAVGVSGGTAEQDLLIARAGAAVVR